MTSFLFGCIMTQIFPPSTPVGPINRIVKISEGGTGASTREQALANLHAIDLRNITPETTLIGLNPDGTLDIPINKIRLGPTVCLAGPQTVISGKPTTYQITNYHAATLYEISTNNGSITRFQDIITYVPGTYTGYSTITINDKVYQILVAPTTVATPSLLYPTAQSTGLFSDMTAVSTVFSSSLPKDIHINSDWQIATNVTFTTLTMESIDDTTHKTSLPVKNLTPGTTYYIRVRHKGSLGATSAWSASVQFSVAAAPIIAVPTIVTPANGATGVLKTTDITSSVFTVANGTDTHSSSDWQLATDSAFTAGLQSVTKDTTHKTSWSVTRLAYETVYYVRVRYNGTSLGTTEWSATASFTTEAQVVTPVPVISVPTITFPTASATGVDLSISATSSAFAVSNGTDTHASSDWQLATDSAFTTIVKSATTDTTNKVTWPLADLVNATTYYIRVKHTGTTLGATTWSTATSFTTVAKATAPSKPSITAPTTGATGLETSVPMTGSAFTIASGTDTHASSDWQLATDAGFATVVKSATADTTNKTTWTASGLSTNTTYYARVRYTGATLGVSEWSDSVSFTTKVPTVPYPSSEVAKTIADDGAEGDIFSRAIAISTDGNTMIIGAPNKTGGKGGAYIFSKSGNNWTLQSSLTLPTGNVAGDMFGVSVAISANGNVAVIGASPRKSATGSAYIYKRSGTTWALSIDLSTVAALATGYSFGQAVSITGDGTKVVVTAPGFDARGAIFIFYTVNSTWALAQSLYADGTGYANVPAGEQFGVSVAFSDDGTTIAVGATESSISAGAVYIFTGSNNTYVLQKKITASDAVLSDKVGTSVALNSSGTVLVTGAPSNATNTGAVYVFTGSGANWTQQAKLLAAPAIQGGNFGFSVDVSSAGDYIIAGAPISGSTGGSVLIFSSTAGVWTQRSVTQASDASANDYYGWSVSIAGTGLFAIVGAYGNAAMKGAAYSYA